MNATLAKILLDVSDKTLKPEVCLLLTEQCFQGDHYSSRNSIWHKTLLKFVSGILFFNKLTDSGHFENTAWLQSSRNRGPSGFRVIPSIILADISIFSLFTQHSNTLVLYTYIVTRHFPSLLLCIRDWRWQECKREASLFRFTTSLLTTG